MCIYVGWWAFRILQCSWILDHKRVQLLTKMCTRWCQSKIPQCTWILDPKRILWLIRMFTSCSPRRETPWISWCGRLFFFIIMDHWFKKAYFNRNNLKSNVDRFYNLRLFNDITLNSKENHTYVSVQSFNQKFVHMLIMKKNYTTFNMCRQYT